MIQFAPTVRIASFDSFLVLVLQTAAEWACLHRMLVTVHAVSSGAVHLTACSIDALASDVTPPASQLGAVSGLHLFLTHHLPRVYDVSFLREGIAVKYGGCVPAPLQEPLAFQVDSVIFYR